MYRSAAAAENCLGLGDGGSKILKFFQSSAAAAGFFLKRSAAAAAQPLGLHLYLLVSIMKKFFFKLLLCSSFTSLLVEFLLLTAHIKIFFSL
jgi:hypothetical protein